MFDVIVIGGGVIGGLVLRELEKYELNACLLEKENDVCMGASKANSGIVHAGFDAKVGSLKAKFNVLGNKMMAELCADLGVKYVNNGSLVVAFSSEEAQTLNELKARGEQNGVEGLQIINREKLRELEKNISDEAVAALYAPSGGIVCPYELTIAAIGNAMDNGAKLYLNFEVSEIKKADGGYAVRSCDGKEVFGKVIINCTGLASEKIAKLTGDNFKTGGRTGEYILLDRESGDFVNHTLFFTPTKLGKGILITQTVDGNILLGPTAEECDEPNTQTTPAGLNFVQEKVKKMCKNPPLFNTITSFAGIRAYSYEHDFIIEPSKNAEGVIHLAGIESPGLTASPAIAKYAVEELVGKILPLTKNRKFSGTRKADYFFKNLCLEQKNELIISNPAYGKIVCRCEQITEGEIIRALRENPPARDVDGVKRRTRAGMGRCQGGFCQPQVAELIANELGVSLNEVTKSGGDSFLLSEVTK